MSEGFRVTEAIRGAHSNPNLADYPLLPGDLLVRESDNTWMKEAPGLAVGGFILTPEQQASLNPVTFDRHGLSYVLGGDVA